MIYLKAKDGVVQKYPYSIYDMKVENSQVSFPENITDAILREFDVYEVIDTPKPQYDSSSQVCVESEPIFDAGWRRVWSVRDLTSEEIQQILQSSSQNAQRQRQEAYVIESDPIFFKAQRGETTMQEWLDKVQEIKDRYPK